jgi:hypothetical protein
VTPPQRVNLDSRGTRDLGGGDAGSEATYYTELLGADPAGCFRTYVSFAVCI